MKSKERFIMATYGTMIWAMEECGDFDRDDVADDAYIEGYERTNGILDALENHGIKIESKADLETIARLFNMVK